jgi:hypothetical protein
MKKHSPDLCLIGLILTIYAMSMLLTGCMSSKNVQKEHTTTTVDTHTDQTLSVNTSLIDTSHSVSTTQTRTIETVDTNVTIPGSRLTGDKALDDFLGGNPFILDNGDQQVDIRWDPQAKKMVATSIVRDRTVPVKGKRETTSTANETKDNHISSGTSLQGESSTDQKTVTNTGKKAKQTEFSQSWVWFIIGGVVVVGILAFIAFKLLKRFVL